MKCYVHPTTEGIGTCTRCGRAVCAECAVDAQGRIVCRDCLAKGVQTYSGQKAPDTAFLIELVGGFFGLLGLGYMYVGRTNDGVIRLVIWLLYDIIAACVITTLSFAVVGLVCIPFQLAIQIIVPIWSANKLKTELLGGIQP